MLRFRFALLLLVGLWPTQELAHATDRGDSCNTGGIPALTDPSGSSTGLELRARQSPAVGMHTVAVTAEPKHDQGSDRSCHEIHSAALLEGHRKDRA